MPPTCLLPPINTPVLQTGVPATGKDGDTHPHEASGALGPAAGEEEEAQGWRQLPVRSLLQLPTNLRPLPPAGLNASRKMASSPGSGYTALAFIH